MPKGELKLPVGLFKSLQVSLALLFLADGRESVLNGFHQLIMHPWLGEILGDTTVVHGIDNRFEV